MTNFTLDFNDKFEGTRKVVDGVYEVIVNQANEDATPGGAEFINFDVIIRNDVDQDFKNFHIFHRIWKSKKDGKYNLKTFNTLGWAFQLQANKSYSGIDDLLQDFAGKVARATVKNEESEYNGKTYENLNVKRWEQTILTNVQHQFKEKATTSNFDIQDDDLPF